MKLSIALAAASVALFAGTAQAADSAHYEIKKITVREVQDEQQMKTMAGKVDNFSEGCNAVNRPNLTPPALPTDGTGLDPIDFVDVIVDKVINIGKKIWAIVDAGRPVVNVKVDTANALPAGIRCWDELEGWQAPISKLYQVDYENAYGAKVVSYGYRVSFISGGNYQGKGKFLTLATVEPANIKVSWGFRFDAVATVPMVFNQGSKEDPLAGMQLAMNWKISTPIQQTEQTEAFFINGAGTLKRLE